MFFLISLLGLLDFVGLLAFGLRGSLVCKISALSNFDANLIAKITLIDRVGVKLSMILSNFDANLIAKISLIARVGVKLSMIF